MWGGRPRLSGWACGQPIAMKTLWGGNFARSRLSAGFNSPALPRVAARQAGRLRHEGRPGSWVFHACSGSPDPLLAPASNGGGLPHGCGPLRILTSMSRRRSKSCRSGQSRLKAGCGQIARPPKRACLFVGGDASYSFPYHQRVDMVGALVSLDSLQVT